MKTVKQLIAIAFLTLCINVKSNASVCKMITSQSNFFLRSFNSLLVSDDPNLVLNATKDGSRVNLQVSFNGNEGTTGTLKILNGSNELLREFQINLKQSPNNESINLSEYDSGTYTCILVTSSGTHISHFTIN